MCESSVFIRRGDTERLVLNDAAFIRPVEGGVHVEDVLGRSHVIPGHIELIDLMGHRIVVSGD